MYIREVKTRNRKTGGEYSTYRLVKNVRVEGTPKQVNLISIGKLDGLNSLEIQQLSKCIQEFYTHSGALFEVDVPAKIEELAHFYTKKLVQKEFTEKKEESSEQQAFPKEKHFEEIDLNSITGKNSEQIGGEHLCMQAMQELGLDKFLKEELNYSDSQLTNSLIALMGRLLYPGSENSTAKWLNDNSAIDEFYPLKSAKVNKNQLYSAANQLYKNKVPIEKYLNTKIEQLLNFKRRIVLYDLTNTHFEGLMEKSDKSTFGRNKQKRNDCRQITLGMLTDEHGFPIHTQYYKGNVSEPSTLELILSDLENLGTSLFSEKPCIIMDAGIATEENIKLLLKKEYEYICVSRSGHKDLINKVEEKELVRFKNKSKKELSAKLFTQEFKYEDNQGNTVSIDESVIYIKSPDKEKKERAMDDKKIERFEDGLKAIVKTVENPKGQRSIAKIHQRLGRLKEKNKGVLGFFDITITDDKKNVNSLIWKRKEAVKKEKKQGVYFLRTNIEQKDEKKLWYLYRIINQVEDAFGSLKSELDMRPNFHHSDATIEAHINLCVLAYHVVCYIRYKLNISNIKHGWNEIRRIMATQKRCIMVSRTKSEKAVWTKYCTRPIPELEQIYTAMGYKKVPFYRKNIIM